MSQSTIIHPINPFVAIIDNFIPDHICDEIIELAKEEGMQRSGVGDNAENPQYDYRRTSSGVFLDYTHVPVATFLFKAANELKVRPEQAEKLQVVSYDLGEEYAPHHDAFEFDSKQLHEGGGQRVATALLYLNTPLEGGATEFPQLPVNAHEPGYEILAKKGRCVFFTTTFLGTTAQHPWSLHGSTPVIRGEKYACNLWFRQGQRFKMKTPFDKSKNE